MWKRVTSLSASFYILNICVLLVLRLFMMKYCFSNPVEETFKLSVNLLISPRQILPTKHGGLIVMMFWTVLGWNKWTKSFTIQFLLTKHACDERALVYYCSLHGRKLVTPGYICVNKTLRDISMYFFLC